MDFDRAVFHSTASDKYLLALGKFVHQFSILETHLHLALVQYAGVSDAVARVILSGTRISDSISFIKRIHTETKRELHPYLEKALNGASTINAFRNELLHYGTFFGDESGSDGVVTNMLKKPEASITFTPVSPETLESLALDCRTACACLTYSNIDAPGLPEIARTSFLASAQAPWRYTPPAQEKSRQKTRGNGQKRKRPPEPSPT